MSRYIPLGKFLATAASPIKRCVTCRKYPRLLKSIRRYYRDKIADETDVTQRHFYEAWLVPRGYTPSLHTFLNHYYGCEARAYAREQAEGKESGS